jgi:hypothetical protein
LIAATPIEPDRRAAVTEWFRLLEFVLPCKYCRASFHDYIELQPLTPAIIQDSTTFSRWLYDIHNRVNAKLRGQGLLSATDPSWPSVKAKYATMSQGLCKSPPLLGWDFMTSIAFTTPGNHYKPTPMDDAPENHEHVGTMSLAKRNRYNLLTRAERITALRRWWALIPSILPCPAWRRSWAAAHPIPLNAGRTAVMRWMWGVEEAVCAGLRCPTPHPSQSAMKQEVSAFESPCAHAKKGNTCRTRKHRQRLRVLTARLQRTGNHS